jgi:hypothetical protein
MYTNVIPMCFNKVDVSELEDCNECRRCSDSRKRKVYESLTKLLSLPGVYSRGEENIKASSNDPYYIQDI